MKLFKRILAVAAALALSLCVLGSSLNVSAQTKSTPKMRRPLSNESPMLIVHIDTWNYPDPEKIIDLIPEELLPYVVFNISLSVGTDDAGKFLRSGDGYETSKSWIRACAERGVWCMVQPASGGKSNLPDYNSKTDYEDTLYGEFFRDYPNFLGFNYCEQFWGFDQNGAPSALERYDHFAALLKLTNKYGGYLIISWCGNRWGQNISPLAMLKRNSDYEKAARTYSENLIICDKYTQESYVHDVQSQVLGYWLSGYCGNYGVRYDSTHWDSAKNAGHHDGDYTQSTGLSIMLESMLLNGATVIDGPELIWADDIHEVGVKTVDGYSSRTWDTFATYDNVALDMFKKVTDGSVRIPTREEVAARTKVALIQNVNSGSDNAKYCTPSSLTAGLYRIEGDGALENNYYHYKSTGRYPTIPLMYKFASDKYKEGFTTVVNVSDYASRWGKKEKKVEEFNKLFPKEYSGDLYAGRYLNTWWTYNYYVKGETGKATLDLKYNTCDTIGLSYSMYSSGIITEYSDRLQIYLNNYDSNHTSKLSTDVITVKGATEKPKCTYTVRTKNQKKPTVTQSWSNGVYTLKVTHNGPIDIKISCSGDSKKKLTDYAEPNLTPPAVPAAYKGELQHEGECFDYKNIEKIVSNGYGTGIDGYTGQGYMSFGTKSGAALRDTFKVLEDGNYTMYIRYMTSSNANGLTLKVNGSQKTINLSGGSGWKNGKLTVSLKKGENKIELSSGSTLSSKLYIDNIRLIKE